VRDRREKRNRSVFVNNTITRWCVDQLSITYVITRKCEISSFVHRESRDGTKSLGFYFVFVRFYFDFFVKNVSHLLCKFVSNGVFPRIAFNFFLFENMVRNRITLPERRAVCVTRYRISSKVFALLCDAQTNLVNLQRQTSS